MKYRNALVTGATIGLVLFSTTIASAQIAWSRAHSSPSNDGFLDVNTAPAGRGPTTVADIGTFAPGVGPVTGTDGIVYIGNQEGTVLAFRANGTSAWRRQLPAGHVIRTSPVVADDGSIIVISAMEPDPKTFGNDARDHRARYQLFLNHFTPGGGWSGATPFPERYTNFEQYRGSGVTTAPPNIWRFQGTEVVMIPVLYKVPGGTELRLVALTLHGGSLGDVLVKSFHDEITGSSGLFDYAIFGYFRRGYEGPPARPLPGVAIFNNPNGGTPFIMASDSSNDLIGFTFDVTGSAGKFMERFRAHDTKRTLTSPPVSLIDGHTVIGTEKSGLVFAGPNGRVMPPITGLASLYAAPTRTADGRLVTVDWQAGEVTVATLQLGGPVPRVLARTPVPGISIASPAASRTHVFVATDTAFLSFDAATMTQVKKFDWLGGGLWPPAIGPQGHVYTMAKNILFVFPAPTTSPVARPPDPVRDHRGDRVRDHR